MDYEDRDDQIHAAPIKNDMESIHQFIHDASHVDFMGRFKRNGDGVIIFNFGSNRGEEAYKHPSTLRWIMNKDFPLQVKNIAKDILDGKIR